MSTHFHSNQDIKDYVNPNRDIDHSSAFDFYEKNPKSLAQDFIAKPVARETLQFNERRQRKGITREVRNVVWNRDGGVV